jgi:hypothetical protein
MALTSTMITNASDHMSEVDKAWLITLLRQCDLYKENALVFSSTIVSKVDAANNTIKARMLNAVLKEIDKLGVGVVEIRGDKDAVWWNQQKERQALLNTALYVLYEVDVEGLSGGSGGSTGIFPDKGVYGDVAVGQRPQLVGICGQYVKCSGYPNCTCSLSSVYTVKSYSY